MQQERAIGLLEKGAVDLMATTDLVGGGASALGEWSGGGDESGEGSQEAAFRGKGMTHLGEEGNGIAVVVSAWVGMGRKGSGIGTIGKGRLKPEPR